MRLAKPWLRKSTGTWHVWINNKQVYLGKDETEAFKTYRRLLNSDVPKDATVRLVIERYWNTVKDELAESTLKRRRPILQSFSDFVPATLKVAKLKPLHVQNWLNEHKFKKLPVKGKGKTGKWVAGKKLISPTTKGDYITMLKAVFSWAASMGYVDDNPLRWMKKPTPKKREDFIEAELWPKVVGLALDQPFRDYLTVMLNSGARATEMLTFEAAHLTGSRFILPIDKSKGRKRQRVVYIPDSILPTVKRLAKQYPTGPLFRGPTGEPWNKDSIRGRFKRLRTKLKMPKLTPTTLRHSFAHHRLSSGQDSLIVANLMGHVDTRMVATRYGHVGQNAKLLQAAANAVESPRIPTP
ncbi:tyrosine-type recombinase/integrase [Lacipirellula sp.]|uniref:tyrosine-type recombinase/integrase n=1 Tax=Lacipirellula sp. TaxID=2691419 RepID=UPI003D0AF41C